jgi:hypothetical protein
MKNVNRNSNTNGGRPYAFKKNIHDLIVLTILLILVPLSFATDIKLFKLKSRLRRDVNRAVSWHYPLNQGDLL